MTSLSTVSTRTTAEAKALGNCGFPKLGDLRTLGDLQWVLQDYKKNCLENVQLKKLLLAAIKKNNEITGVYLKNKNTLEFVIPHMQMLDKRMIKAVDNNQKLKKIIRRLEDKFEVDVGVEDSVIDDDDVITDEDGNFTGFIDGINILPLPPNENRKNRGETKRNH